MELITNPPTQISAPFCRQSKVYMPSGLAFNLIDYIGLADWTGRAIRDDKRGAIPSTAVPILQQLGISAEHWVELSTHFESRFKGIVGSVNYVKQWHSQFGLTRTTNRSNSVILYS